MGTITGICNEDYQLKNDSVLVYEKDSVSQMSQFPHSPLCCTCLCRFSSLTLASHWTALLIPLSVCFLSLDCVCVWYNPRGDPFLLPLCNPGCRLCECTEAEAEIVLQLKNELREKELKLTDIRLEALSSAHHLDQIREAMNRMQVRSDLQLNMGQAFTDWPVDIFYVWHWSNWNSMPKCPFIRRLFWLTLKINK